MRTHEICELTLSNSSGIPHEWDGTTVEGEPVYIRWRSGSLAVSIGGSYGLDGERVLELSIDCPHAHRMETDNVIDLVESVAWIDIDPNTCDVPKDVRSRRWEQFAEDMTKPVGEGA